MSEPENSGRGRPSKVARLIDQYQLAGVGEELERRWTAKDPDVRSSLRDLAAYVNRELLRTAMMDASVQPLDGELENIHRLLTADDVAAGDRTRARRRLERNGVDIDTLVDDFVSYQAIRTYLTKHRDAVCDPDDGDRASQVARTVERLRTRTATVTEDRIESLRAAGDIDIGPVRTIVNVRVVCENCGSQHDPERLLAGEGCDCEETDCKGRIP